MVPAFLIIILLSVYPFVFAQISPVGIRDVAIQEAFREQEMILAFKEAALRQAQEEAIEEGLSELPLPFSFHPYVSWDNSYDDNLFQLHINEQRDLINRLTPGFKIIFGELNPSSSQSQRIDLDLGANLYDFRSHPEYNKQKPYGKFFLNLGRGKHRLSVDDSFKEDFSENSSIVSGETGFADFWMNSSHAAWESVFNKFGFDMEGTRDFSEYKKDSFKSDSTYLNTYFAGSVFLQPFPKTRFFLGYNYGWIDYTRRMNKATDSQYERYWIGVRGELAKKLSGLAKLGLESRNFKDKVDGENDLTYAMDLEYQFSKKTIFLMNVSKGLKNPTYVSLTLDKGTDTSLGMRYTINRHFSCSLKTNYVTDRYDNERKDKTYQFNGSLNYTYKKWFGMYLGYVYALRESNSTDNDYESNVYSLGGRFIF